MATIKIDNLSVSGSEFFSDYESYLDQLAELSETDVFNIKGGTSPTTITLTLLFIPTDAY